MAYGNHPDHSQVGSPCTKASTLALWEAARKRKSSTNVNAKLTVCERNKRKSHLSNLEIADFIVGNFYRKECSNRYLHQWVRR